MIISEPKIVVALFSSNLVRPHEKCEITSGLEALALMKSWKRPSNVS
jgi:hypothetical protein